MSNQTNHEGNYCTIVARAATYPGMELRLYTHSREGRFLSVGRLSLPESQLRYMLKEIDNFRLAMDQPVLPPFEEDNQDNVRWLPPQP